MSTTSADADLIRQVRSGDEGAFATLYATHAPAARRFARSLARSAADAEDLVADSFARVLNLLRQGRGPTDGFLDYLLTTIRNRHIDLGRSERTTPASDRPWLFDEASEPLELETATDGMDSGNAVSAFAALPERWQRVLWHTEVEGRTVAEVAHLLDIRPASVSALLYRAREGLRLAYLEQHREPVPAGPDCAWVQARLAQHLRGKLSRRASSRATDHLATCAACAGIAARMAETNDRFALLFLPVVVTGGAAVYAAGSGAAPTDGSAPPSTGTAQGSRALSGRGRWHQLTSGWPAAATASVAAIVVAAAAVAAVAFWPGGADDPHVPAAIASPTAREDVSTPTAVPDDPELPDRPLPVALPIPAPSSTPTADAAGPRPEPAGPAAPPQPVVVRPVAPTATPITSCGSYGRLVLPTTTGVQYLLTRGDGKAGPWTVTARARSGYVLAASATATFEGDLGTYRPCPSVTGVTRAAAGSGWTITTELDAQGAGPYDVAVELRFDDVVYVGAGSGAGWSCWATDGSTRLPLDGTGEYQLQPGAQWVRCEATYDGTALATVEVTVNISASTPTGTVHAFRGSTATGNMTF